MADCPAVDGPECPREMEKDGPYCIAARAPQPYRFPQPYQDVPSE